MKRKKGRKEGMKGGRKEISKGKIKLLIFLLLIYLTDNNLFKIIITTMYLVMYASAYITLYTGISLYRSKINESDDTMHEMKELKLFWCYKVLTRSVKCYSVI